MPGRPTTMTPERVAEALRLHADGASLIDAARSMGVNVSTLRCWGLRRGLRFRDGRLDNVSHPVWMTPERDAEARRLASEGVTKTEAARRLGVPFNALVMWSLRKAVPFTRPLGRGGSALPLTEAERRLYRRMSCVPGIPRADKLRAIGRADLAEAHA